MRACGAQGRRDEKFI